MQRDPALTDTRPARERIVTDVREFLARPGRCWRCGGRRTVHDVDRPETCRRQACPACAGGRTARQPAQPKRDNGGGDFRAVPVGERHDPGGFYATCRGVTPRAYTRRGGVS